MSELAPNSLQSRIRGDLESEYNKRADKQVEAVSKAAKGDFEGAVALLQDNLTWCEENLGESHGLTVWHLEELAIQLANLDRLTEAFDFDDRAYRIRKQATLGDSPKTLRTLDHLAFVLSRLGRHELAAEHYELLWNAQKKKFGDSHENTLRTATNLAGCWQRIYKTNSDKSILSKATQLHSEVLQARTKQEPPDVASLVQSREDLGVNYISENKLEKAKELFSKNIEELKALPKSTSVEVAGLKDRNEKFLKLIEGQERVAKSKRAEDRRRRKEQEDRAKKEKEVQERDQNKKNESNKSSRPQSSSNDRSKNGIDDVGLSPQPRQDRPRAASEASKQRAGGSDKKSDQKRAVSEDRSKQGNIKTEESKTKDAAKPQSGASTAQKPEIKFTYKHPEEVRKQQSSGGGPQTNGEKKGTVRAKADSKIQRTTLPAIVVQDTNLRPPGVGTTPSKTPQTERASSVPPNARRQDPKIERSTSKKEEIDSKLSTRSDVGINSDTEQASTEQKVKRKRKNMIGGIFDARDGQPDDNTVGWLDNMQSINEDILDNLRKSKGTRVKIAVLDTGVDLSHRCFQDKRSKRRIQACENFLDDGETSDLCGHGTHCVQLIRSLAPEADIYVARCVKDFDTDPDEFAIIKAIQRACRPKGKDGAKLNWDVDIISLSLGFYSHKRAMAKALDEAISREKLIFAAASNNGSMRQMTFPAYLDRIICVNACDGLGTALNINPPPAKRDDKRLAILGENVESAWKCEPGSNNTMKIKTGTSVATPIAAAVAALILEIAIMPSNSAAESVFKRCLPYMRDSIGMTAILKDMANERDSFFGIMPWIGIFYDKNAGTGGDDGYDIAILSMAVWIERLLRGAIGPLPPPDECS